MSKHTPGPWRLIDVSEPDYIKEVLSDDGRCIAEVIESDKPETVWANARLIAAAPELLEVLEKVQAWMNGGNDDELAYEIDLALTKAKGE